MRIYLINKAQPERRHVIMPCSGYAYESYIDLELLTFLPSQITHANLRLRYVLSSFKFSW